MRHEIHNNIHIVVVKQEEIPHNVRTKKREQGVLNSNSKLIGIL